MDAGPSTPPRRSRVDIQLPANFLIMPFTAAFVGLLLGMSRGGRRERLRFLAENAHRAPRTVQGWYFYTKTRNYRVFFAAARTGARYALGLGAATTAFVLLEEGSGVMREQYLGRRALKSRRASERYSWRDGGVGWEDGAVAGGFMGAGVGLAYRLPRTLFVQALAIGLVLGTVTSSLQIAQERLGQHIDIPQPQVQNIDHSTPISAELSRDHIADSTAVPTPWHVRRDHILDESPNSTR